MSAPKALWEVMRKAYAESSGSIINDLGQEVLSGPDREEFAAMIRAIVEARLPEEPMVVEGGRTYEQALLTSERERLRRLMLADADEAEAADRAEGND